MKKFMALILALVIAASLCVPAAAASDEYWEGYWEGETSGYQDGYADFEAGKACKYPLDYDGGYETAYRDSYIAGYADAQYEAELYDADYDAGYADGYEAGCADAQNGVYFNPMHEYDSEDHYEAGYAEGYDAGYWDALYGGEDSGSSPDALIASYGGVPGQVNVMVNGRCVDFGTVAPVNRNGRVIAPIRAILEALGAEVTYDHSTRVVTAVLGGKTLCHAIGTESIDVYTDPAQEPEHYVMDCNSYVSGGRTLAPVRFLSEAFGYDVDWDDIYQTVVILDLSQFCETYDSQLTVMNLVLSDARNRIERGKTYRQDTSLNLDMTVFDTLNGDKRLGASANTSILSNQTGANATLKMDLSQVIDLVMAEYESDTEAEAKELLALLRQLQVDMIYNAETEQVYVKSPVINLMLGQEAWVESSLLEMTGYLGNVLDDSALTMAEVVMAASLANSYSSPINSYGELVKAMDGMVMLLGDQNFTKSGSTWTLNADALAEQLGTALDDEFYWLLDDYYGSEWKSELTFQVTDTGSGTCSYSCRLYFRCEELELEFGYAKRGAGTDVTAKLHVRNLFRGTLTGSSTLRTSNESVQTVPPAAEISMDVSEIYF